MVQAPIRTAFSGPALVRLLARLADLDVQQPGSSLSDRLSQWLGWTDAIALSTALASDAPATVAARTVPADDEHACKTLRARLAKDITRDERRELAARGRHRFAPQTVAEEPPADFADYRQRYLSLQQTMETDIGELRGRLRAAISARSPDMARLAVVDAVMEQALGARERSLLAQVPMLLGQHFERLKRAHAAREDASAESWIEPFRRDMQSVLLAELEVRFQPVEGLLAALRTPDVRTH
jgi:hypothetical protein